MIKIGLKRNTTVQGDSSTENSIIEG